MNVIITQTSNTTYEEDMKQRDMVADMYREINRTTGIWPDVQVTLHANLDAREIQRAIKRYKGIPVEFHLVDYDSTPSERKVFRERWRLAGGPEIEP